VPGPPRNVLDGEPERPVGDRTLFPGRSTSLITSGATGRSPGRAEATPTTAISSPADEQRGSASAPIRELWPLQVGDQREWPPELGLDLPNEAGARSVDVLRAV